MDIEPREFPHGLYDAEKAKDKSGYPPATRVDPNRRNGPPDTWKDPGSGYLQVRKNAESFATRFSIKIEDNR